MNPVIASLMFGAAQRVLRSQSQAAGCSLAHARMLLQCATDQISLLVREDHSRVFPVSLAPTPAPPASETFEWAAAMLTAPRSAPKIETAIGSLRTAGFTSLRIFAEPNAWLPESIDRALITRRSIRHGNFLNFYACLSTMLEQQPHADAYAVFQDDIHAAAGMREWCEAQLWPMGNGVVSLFTPKIHSQESQGWRIVAPGVQRVCGAQALVFRGDWLRMFLSDPHVLHELQLRNFADDAILGGWLGRNGLGIAYYTPSPVQHLGTVSSICPIGVDLRNFAHAVEDISSLDDWRPPDPRPGTIGLVGWNTKSGLGSLNRDLIRNLGIRHWLCTKHRHLPSLSNVIEVGDVEITTDTSAPSMQRWLRSLDWLIFAEHPYMDEIPTMAAHAGLRIACIPMWELLQPELPWLQFVDLMICPTRHAEIMMRDWVERYGFGWKTIYVPWPIGAQRFQMRQRSICQNFLFINGWGGGHPETLTGSPSRYSRKGLELILEAACMAPDLQFTIRSLAPLPEHLPANVRVAPPTENEADLYNVGDVCIQPSLYEGLGMQLLECQAAGMPLITTDAAPMNEVNPWRLIPTQGTDVVHLWGNYFSSALLCPEDLINTLRPLVGQDVSEASRQARHYVETHRNWTNVRAALFRELTVWQ